MKFKNLVVYLVVIAWLMPLTVENEVVKNDCSISPPFNSLILSINYPFYFIKLSFLFHFFLSHQTLYTTDFTKVLYRLVNLRSTST